MSGYTLQSGVATAVQSAYCPVCRARTEGLNLTYGTVQYLSNDTLTCSKDCSSIYKINSIKLTTVIWQIAEDIVYMAMSAEEITAQAQSTVPFTGRKS